MITSRVIISGRTSLGQPQPFFAIRRGDNMETDLGQKARHQSRAPPDHHQSPESYPAPVYAPAPAAETCWFLPTCAASAVSDVTCAGRYTVNVEPLARLALHADASLHQLTKR